MKKSDVSTIRLREVIEQLPGTFRTKHVSTHPDIQRALRRHADNPRFHQIIGMRLSEKDELLGIRCVDRNSNATWQKVEANAGAALESVPGSVEHVVADSSDVAEVSSVANVAEVSELIGGPPAADRSADVFLNENLNHPENRINVALFGLMTQEWLRTWFLNQLDLPIDAIVYPPTNENGVRPDFKVVGADGTSLAWIEVELGTNPAQVANYRDRFAEPVKTVYGRRSHGGDLSLEQIADRLAAETGLPAQTTLNVQHLHDQIRQGLSGFSSASLPRAEVSDQMREHPLVAGLVERLGSKLQFTTAAIPVGYLKADTNKEQGFSLRVNSRVATNGTLSLLAISGGRPNVIFPSLPKLNRYLPAHGEAVAAFADLLDELGCDIGSYEERQRPSIPLEVVLDELDRLAGCVAALADRPGRR